MSLRLSAIALCIALAAMSAHAQSASELKAGDRGSLVTEHDTRVLPVWNNKSGKVEALLLLQPGQEANSSSLFGVGAGFKTHFGTLQADVSAEGGSGLALLCNSSTGLVTLGSLAGRCMLASFDAAPSLSSQQAGDPYSNSYGQSHSLRAETRFVRPESLFALSVGRTEASTNGAGWLSPTAGLVPGMSILGGNLSQQDISARGQMKLGDNGWVSIGGTLARAQLIPATGQGSSVAAQHWNTSSVGVAMGRGAFSGEVIGRVVDAPGLSNTLNSFDIGLSWKTPWQGKLTLGAEKSTGTSPLAPAVKPSQQDDGTVPYVRYHQDL